MSPGVTTQQRPCEIHTHACVNTKTYKQCEVRHNFLYCLLALASTIEVVSLNIVSVIKTLYNSH